MPQRSLDGANNEDHSASIDRIEIPSRGGTTSATIDDLAANQSVDNLPVHVRRIPDVTQAKVCAIVFISADEGDHLREDLAILSTTEVLTVSDASDFLNRGGMIQFLLIQNHVRFAVNLNAVNHAHLVLSSELLRVASSVTGKPPSGGLP